MAHARMARLVLALSVVGLAAGSANAWIITQIDPVPGSGLAESTVLRFDTQAGQDLFEIHKYYLEGFAPSLVSIRLEFMREAGDQDTIKIADEVILNTTLFDWHDYHVALEFVPFSGDEVAFNDPNLARAKHRWGGDDRLGGTPYLYSPTQIDWEPASKYPLPPPGWASVPAGTFADAPTNQLMIIGLKIDVSQLEVGDVFVLKQWPTIPEPSTLVVLLAVFAPAALRRLGRRHQ